MAITSNVGGVLKTLQTIHSSVGGTLKELRTIHTNVGGVLKKIFSSAPFKVLTGTLTKPSGESITSVTDPSLTNVVITQACTAKIKVHIDAIGIGSGSVTAVRSILVNNSATWDPYEQINLKADSTSDWYDEIQLIAGTYNFKFAVFDIYVTVQGSSARATYSSSTFTYEISFS